LSLPTQTNCFISPPKIKTIRIVENPFDDIVPRITAEEKRAQQRAREEAQKEREEAERRKGAKKCVCALSLGIKGLNFSSCAVTETSSF
jgi:hypothetical protein